VFHLIFFDNNSLDVTSLVEEKNNVNYFVETGGQFLWMPADNG